MNIQEVQRPLEVLSTERMLNGGVAAIAEVTIEAVEGAIQSPMAASQAEVNQGLSLEDLNRAADLDGDDLLKFIRELQIESMPSRNLFLLEGKLALMRENANAQRLQRSVERIIRLRRHQIEEQTQEKRRKRNVIASILSLLIFIIIYILIKKLVDI